MRESRHSTQPETNAVITVQNVTKVYRQGKIQVHALRGITLDFFPGEFTAIVGPSGSGKSTLLNLVGGLDTPSSGEITIEGHKLSSLSRGELSELRKNRLGFVFQAYNLIPVFTALENAEFVLDLQGIPATQKHKIAKEALRDVGLEGFENRKPDELSGGQQQRVAVARALAAKPAMVLADEPTANLDSKTAESLLDVMVELNSKRGATFLFSTHDEQVMRRARRIIHLKDGKVDLDETRP